MAGLMMSTQEIVNRWLEEAAALGDEDSYSAKRTAKRFSCYWEIDMKVGHATHRVTARDVSSSGVGIISPVEVGSGRTVELRREPEDPWVRARIVHSTQTVGRYKLGAIIQFDSQGPRERSADDTPRLAESLIALANLKLSRGDGPAAEILLRDCYETRKQSLGETHWLTAVAQSLLGECLITMERYAGAESLLLESYVHLKNAQGADHENSVVSLERIVQLYEAWGKPDKADEYRALI
jgi:tetratricopeptide repeat protein/PilZ domain-containing protein